jgi:hypothetical protein
LIASAAGRTSGNARQQEQPVSNSQDLEAHGVQQIPTTCGEPNPVVTVFCVTVRFVPSEQFFDEASAIVDAIA